MYLKPQTTDLISTELTFHAMPLPRLELHYVQYCAKVMRAKFVLCSHKFSTKFRTMYRDLSSKIRRTLEELSRGQLKSRKRCSFHHVQRHNAMFTSKIIVNPIADCSLSILPFTRIFARHFANKVKISHMS